MQGRCPDARSGPGGCSRSCRRPPCESVRRQKLRVRLEPPWSRGWLVCFLTEQNVIPLEHDMVRLQQRQIGGRSGARRSTARVVIFTTYSISRYLASSARRAATIAIMCFSWVHRHALPCLASTMKSLGMASPFVPCRSSDFAAELDRANHTSYPDSITRRMARSEFGH